MCIATRAMSESCRSRAIFIRHGQPAATSGLMIAFTHASRNRRGFPAETDIFQNHPVTGGLGP